MARKHLQTPGAKKAQELPAQEPPAQGLADQEPPAQELPADIEPETEAAKAAAAECDVSTHSPVPPAAPKFQFFVDLEFDVPNRRTIELASDWANEFPQLDFIPTEAGYYQTKIGVEGFDEADALAAAWAAIEANMAIVRKSATVHSPKPQAPGLATPGESRQP